MSTGLTDIVNFPFVHAVEQIIVGFVVIISVSISYGEAKDGIHGTTFDYVYLNCVFRAVLRI